MTRKEYERQANGLKEHEIYYPSGLDNQKRSKPRHAALCPCDYDNIIPTFFDEREEFAAIYLGHQRCSDEPEESPESGQEEEEKSWDLSNTPHMEDIFVRTATFALYSFSHSKFIGVLDQDKRVIEWNPTLIWGYGARALIIPIEIALEMHSSAKYEREYAALKIEHEQFVTNGQMFYAQLCTKVKKMAL